MSKVKPRYPVFVPTKSRYESALTIKCLRKHEVPFYAVVEAEEVDAYANVVGDGGQLLVLPESGQGLIYVRNWIKDYCRERGHFRHWQLDDNIKQFLRSYKGERVPCTAGLALRVCEDFTDRYENVPLSGLEYYMFATGINMPPFVHNCRVYSCSLIQSDTPWRWRAFFNDDVDMCLQVLAAGFCTILVKCFMCDKRQTMALSGGNTELYKASDGRLKMAHCVERMWPYVIETKRRFDRPQHVVHDAWKRFDTPLIRKAEVDLSALQGADPYNCNLTKVKEPKAAVIKQWLADQDGG